MRLAPRLCPTPTSLSATAPSPAERSRPASVRVPIGLAPLGNAAWRCVATLATARRGADRLVRWRTTGAGTRGRRPPGSRVLRRGGAGCTSGWADDGAVGVGVASGLVGECIEDPEGVGVGPDREPDNVPTSSLAPRQRHERDRRARSCCPSAATILATKGTPEVMCVDEGAS